MKFLDLFAGIGGFRSALVENGHEPVGFVEIDKFARKSYENMYDTKDEWTKWDITKVTNEEFAELKGKVDIITGGFPCFAAGTLITTSEGLKNIEDVQKGDKVLTHTNTFKEVVEPMVKQKKGIYSLKLKGLPETLVTEEHPYYVRTMKKVFDTKTKTLKKSFSEPYWVDVKDLDTKKHYVGSSQNNENVNPYNFTEEEAFLMGKYILDEAVSLNSIDSERLTLIDSLMDNVGKEIPNFLLSLPNNLLEKVVSGLIEDRAELKFGEYSFTTVSIHLVYSLGQAIQKLYHTELKTEIYEDLGLVNISFRKEPLVWLAPIYIDDMLWTPIEEISFIPEWEGKVYNFEVAEDNSYVANNATVHNCQSFSIAGKRLGFADETRGTLFFDIIRAAEMIEPKILFLENVKGLLGHDNGNTFRVMLGALNDLGYEVDYAVFNSKYFEVPQNRERIFIVATKNYEKNWKLQDIVDSHKVVNKRLKDVLEDSVEDKFYLSEEKMSKILNVFDAEGMKGNYLKLPKGMLKGLDMHSRIYHKESVSPTVLATSHPTKVAVEEPKVENPLKNKTEYGWHFEQAVYTEDGLSRTLKAGGGSGNIPKVIRQEVVDTEPKITVVGNTSNTGHRSHNIHGVEGISPTLTARDFKGPKQIAYEDNEAKEFIVRKLNPLETWRLQGFTDEQFYKAQEVNSNSQLYKQSGNSVTVNVIKKIAEQF